MDVAEEVWDLIENLKAHFRPENERDRLAWALRLEDIFRREHEVTFASDALQHVVDFIIPFESKLEVRNSLFDAVSRGLSSNRFAEISLDELLHYVEEDDTPMISHVLILMAKVANPTHRARIEGWRSHPNEIVRKNAEYALKHGYGGAP